MIDATGKYVTPGFIDIHSHADDGSGPRGGFRDANPVRRSAPNLVSQGITTVVVNQDGRSPWPLTEQRALLEKNGIGTNAMLLVGHGTVRRRVMGEDVRRPARAGRDRADARAGEAGAAARRGRHVRGLEYDPGRWSTTDEVVELAKELPAFNGIYISHERSEGSDPLWYVPSQDGPTPSTLLDAVRETIEIGEKTGARVVASHLKAKGEHYWGSSAAAINLIQRARDRGVDVWADQYPYPTSGTDGSTVLIPAWATRPPGAGPNQPRTNRADVLKRVLGDPPSAKLVRSDIAHEIRRRGGAETSPSTNTPTRRSTENRSPRSRGCGNSIRSKPRSRSRWRACRNATAARACAASRWRKSTWRTSRSSRGSRRPPTAASRCRTDGPSTHARFYGSFTRKIRHYALDRGAITLEHAIRSSTALPARIMDLKDRGQIREGFAADLVIFDLATIRDKATFFEPHQHSEGIDYVFINGTAVVDGGKLTQRHARQGPSSLNFASISQLFPTFRSRSVPGTNSQPPAETYFRTVLLYYLSNTVILLKPNPSSGVPIYLQLMEQVKHAIETGALQARRAAAEHPAAGGRARHESQHRRQGVSRARARRRHRAAPGRRRVRVGQGADATRTPNGCRPRRRWSRRASRDCARAASRTRKSAG